MSERFDVFWFGSGVPKVTRLKFSWGYPARRPSFRILSLTASDTELFLLTEEGDSDLDPLGSRQELYRFKPGPNAVEPKLIALPDKPVLLPLRDIVDDHGSALLLLTRIGAMWRLPLDAKSDLPPTPTRVHPEVRPHILSSTFAVLARSPLPVPPPPVPQGTLLADLASLFIEAQGDTTIQLADGTLLKAYALFLKRSPVLRSLLDAAQV